jgi:hypothetical protein
MLAASESDKLEWRGVDGSDDVFAVGAESGSVRICSVDKDGTHPLRLSVLNPAGEMMAESQTVVGERYMEWEHNLKRLYDLARNSALGIRNVFRDLERDLGLEAVSDEARGS